MKELAWCMISCSSLAFGGTVFLVQCQSRAVLNKTGDVGTHAGATNPRSLAFPFGIGGLFEEAEASVDDEGVRTSPSGTSFVCFEDAARTSWFSLDAGLGLALLTFKGVLGEAEKDNPSGSLGGCCVFRERGVVLRERRDIVGCRESRSDMS